ncbi:MAG: DUF1501 domain-containing protein [Planctomycetaceae bacterium]|nr:DUF1501 domain-containing protein [Planctomycetaceae bacterium]
MADSTEPVSPAFELTGVFTPANGVNDRAYARNHVEASATPAGAGALPVPRRSLLSHASAGVAAIGLAALMQREGAELRADEQRRPAAASLAPGVPGLHHAAKATSVIHIFLGGGLSQVDSFDYKPELEKYHDRDLPPSFGTADAFFGKVGRLHKAHYPFHQRGDSGLWISDLFPELAKSADHLCVIRSMNAETANHIPGIFQANTGFRQMGFPAMGAWLSYGLGSENEDLPTFIVLPDSRGIPNAAGGAFNWSSGFLPAQHQGVAFQTRSDQPIPDLTPSEPVADEVVQQRTALLRLMNEQHLASQAETDPLQARIRSYELAARMQRAIPEAMNLSSEPEHIQKLYGMDREECRDVARNCLAARRLVERGVRVVQIWTGDGVSWDAHGDILGNGYKSHSGEALRVDRPIHGLIQDLAQNGLLESTIVMITTEFGRTPYAQSSQGTLSRGRDHHPEGFTNLLLGAGLKRGIAYGETDEIGYSAIVNPVTTYDLHATVLHLMGIDHERLTVYHNGLQRRLTNVHGQVIEEILS